jgi:hypothetical protein
MGLGDRPAAGHTGAMINLGNLFAHKLDAAFGACPPLVPAGGQRPPLPCQRPLRSLTIQIGTPVTRPIYAVERP